MSAEELIALRSRIDDRLRALGAYDFVALKEGSKGDEVTALQTRLQALGYFTQKIDGRYRATTTTAMKAFEKAAGLRRDGAASVEDQKVLFSDNAPAVPTPTPSPVPTPSPTPNKNKDYNSKLDYRLSALMESRYTGSRYQLNASIVAVLDGDRWLMQMDGSAGGLIAVSSLPETRTVGDHVRIFGEYQGLTEYESQSGPVTLPLIKCEYLD